MRLQGARRARPQRLVQHRGMVVALAVGIAILVAGAVAVLRTNADPDPASDAGAAPAASRTTLRWGVTHTQVSADAGDPAGVAAAHRVLGRQPLLQNQHIMGWGVGNPEPAPGEYDFDDLDRRIELIRRTDGVPVITLCCAPDWMRGGRPGHTDWSELESAPLPEHYRDFADLAGKVAARYPDVRHFIVWNELKGFFDPRTDRWDYEGYTRLYNLVYAAVKRVDPRNQVGGPYPAVDSEAWGGGGSPSGLAGPWGVVDQRSLDVVEYWLDHMDGADFVVLDATTTVRDGQLTTDPFTALGKFEALGTWMRQRTDLPLWFAEWYVEPRGAHWGEPQRAAVQAAAMITLARSGVSSALYWNPQTLHRPCAGCLWTDTSSPGGGRATRLADVLSGFARYFPAGTRLVTLPTSSADVEVLAQPRHAVVVNTVDRPVRVTVGREAVSLEPYEVRFVSHGGS